MSRSIDFEHPQPQLILLLHLLPLDQDTPSLLHEQDTLPAAFAAQSNFTRHSPGLILSNITCHPSMALHAACLILLFLIWTINQSIAWALPPLLSWSRWPVIQHLSLKARSHIPTRLSLAQRTRWSQTVQLYPNYLGMSHTMTRPSDRCRTRRLYQYLPIEILTVVLLILNISRFTTRLIR